MSATSATQASWMLTIAAITAFSTTFFMPKWWMPGHWIGATGRPGSVAISEPERFSTLPGLVPGHRMAREEC